MSILVALLPICVIALRLSPPALFFSQEAKLVFDSSGYTMVKDRIAEVDGVGKNPQMKCFDGKGAVSGKLVIVPPEGREVGHNGVEIILRSYCHLIDSVDTFPGDVVCKKWVLLEAGSIAEPIEVAFDIDLSELDLRDTFDGEKMCFRHMLGYRIVRPWYTFSVRGEEAIAIRNCPPPKDAPPPPVSSTLVVSDFGGVCTLDHGKCSFSADGRLIGSITFSEMQPGTNVAEVALLLGRTEMWGESTGQDATVRYHVIHPTQHAPISSDCTLPVDIALAQTGAESGQDGPLPPSVLPLVPVDPDCEKSNAVSVTYWVRVLLAMTPSGADEKTVKKHWSTHPILLLPGTEAGGV
jgi:hypothetical protein